MTILPDNCPRWLPKIFLLLMMVCTFSSAEPNKAQVYSVKRATVAPVIDGRADDEVWKSARWKAIDQIIVGPPVEEEDFSGRYKLLWNQDYLFILAEIHDDVLADFHPNPLDRYWNDDALEILIDENASGGNHHYNYNAFAYHIALDNQAVDVGPFLDSARTANIRTYPEHVFSRWQRSPQKKHPVIWEVSVSVFNDSYKDDKGKEDSLASAEKLFAGKTLGFMLAYCDSDTTGQRENFITDKDIKPVNGDKNRAYIDASVFGKITLVD